MSKSLLALRYLGVKVTIQTQVSSKEYILSNRRDELLWKYRIFPFHMFENLAVYQWRACLLTSVNKNCNLHLLFNHKSFECTIVLIQSTNGPYSSSRQIRDDAHTAVAMLIYLSERTTLHDHICIQVLITCQSPSVAQSTSFSPDFWTLKEAVSSLLKWSLSYAIFLPRQTPLLKWRLNCMTYTQFLLVFFFYHSKP